MASKRLKKKRQKQQEMVQDNLVVNFVNVVSANEEKASEEPTIQMKINKDVTEKENSKMKMNFYVQYMGKEYNEQEIVNQIKQDWKNEGNKIGDMRTLDVYLKVEEGKAYYIINGTINKELSL